MSGRPFEIICSDKDRQRWLLERRNGIGASEIAAALGQSRYDSPMSVCASKWETEEPSDEQSESAFWGHLLEPFVLREYRKRTGRRVRREGKLIASKLRPWQRATLDGRQYAAEGEEREGPGIVELKTTTLGDDWKEGPPTEALLQVCQQYAVTGWKWATLVVFIGSYGGFRLRWWDVERNEDLIKLVTEGGRELWERIESDTPPDPDGHKATREALRKIYPEDNGTVVELPGDLLDEDHARTLIDDEIKKLTARRELIDQRIMLAIGDASTGVFPSGVKYHHKANKNGVRSLRRYASKGE